jgi:class 3 adenylate cyclase
VLDRCFGRLVELVTAHGGEVLKFAGDAALALWQAGPEGGLRAAVQSAAACALAVRQGLDGLEAAPGIRLRLRQGLGAGEAWSASVGGVEGRWEALVAGSPLAEAADAEGRAQPGEVVLSAAAKALLSGRGNGEPLTGGYLRLQGLLEPPPLRPAGEPVLLADAEEALRAYVPRSVQTRVDAGQTEWLGEFRNATTLFCNVRGLECGAAGALDRTQEVTRCLQAAVYR